MSITKQEQMLYERYFLNFFRVHDEWRMQANRSLIELWLDQNVLAITPENLEIAALALGDKLAVREKEPLPPPPVVLPPPEVSLQKRSKAEVKAFLRENRPKPVASRAELQAQRTIPAEFTRERIASREFSRDEMQRLIEKYGRKNVIDRLEGRS